MNRTCVAVAVAMVALAEISAAQIVTVVGTGDPTVDVPAVQGAVDRGSRVVLRGHFSFDRPPTAPAGATYLRMVTVSRNVEISGNLDENGDMATIEGGEWPFLVDAVDSRVTIQGLRFVHPTAGAIWVYAVAGLAVTGCRIENIEPSVVYGMQAGQPFAVSTAIFAGGDPHPPKNAYPGKPENFSGTLAILNNDIDVGAMPSSQTLGIVIFAVGKSPDKEVDIYVSGNNIRNVTEPAINFRVIGGRASAERNVIVTGAVTVGAANPNATTSGDAIRVAGSGSYLIAHNSIDCGRADGAAAGITLFGQAEFPEASAVIVDNDVTMSAAEGTVFGAVSAGIEIRGFAQSNSVLNNRIRGRGKAALNVLGQNGGTPGDSVFVANDLAGFQSSIANVFVDAGATNTFVIGGPATVEDHGTGTVVLSKPMASR